MRSFLLVVIVLESVALIAAGASLLFGVEEQTVETPSIRSFRPPAYESVIGDKVRYRIVDRKSQALVGYLEYRVEWAEEYQGTNFGRTYRVQMTRRDTRGHKGRQRKIIIRPRDITHGWLPPDFDEELRTRVPGAQPVIASIETATVKVFRKEHPGYLVKAVIPRRSLTEIAEQFWITDRVPLFGVARFIRGEHDYVLDSMEDHRS